MKNLLLISALFALAYCGPRGGSGGQGGQGGQGGPGGQGRRGGRGGPPGPPPPPYLQGLNKTAVDEYVTIIQNNDTIAQQNAEITTWASKWGVSVSLTLWK